MCALYRNVSFRSVTKSTLVVTHFDCLVSVDSVCPAVRLMMSMSSPSIQETRESSNTGARMFQFLSATFAFQAAQKPKQQCFRVKGKPFPCSQLVTKPGECRQGSDSQDIHKQERIPKGNHIFFEIYIGLRHENFIFFTQPVLLAWQFLSENA